MTLHRWTLWWVTLLASCHLGLRAAAGVETDPPVVTAVFPEPGAIHALTTVEVHFNEAVTGVDATDLLAEGVPCTDLHRVSPDVYVFTLPPLVLGNVRLTWSKGSGIVDQADVPNLFAGADAIEYTLLAPPRPGGVVLNEILPDNQKNIRDEDGDYSDWIELRNITDADIRLEGWHLTDDPDQLKQWTFPDVTLPAQGYLVVFASGKDRSSPTNRLHTNFKLKNDGEYLGLTDADGVVINDFAPRYPSTASNVSFGRANGALDQTGYFSAPTPGAPNSVSGNGFASAIGFSVPGGLIPGTPLDLTLALSLADPTPDTIIRVTLDGKLPTLDAVGFTYAGPFQVTSTNAVMVRARAFRPNFFPGPVHTEYYMPMIVSRLGPVLGTNPDGQSVRRVIDPNIQQFRSDLPVVVVNTYGRPIYESGNTVVRFSIFEPKDGVTSVTNAPDLATRGGMKIRGSSSASLTKKQYAIQWTDDFEQDVDHPVLGMPSDSEWVLYAPNDFEPVSIHNPFIHQLARDIGSYSPRTRFVELFINKTGPLGTNNYEGLYVLMEKPSISSKRVPGPKLQPEVNTLPDVSGTYLMKIDRTDPGDSGIPMGGQTVAMISPKEKELKQAARAPQKKYIVDFLNAMNKGFLPANRRDPTNTYENFIEMNEAIDYHIVEMLSGNVDTMVLSAYFYKPRDQKLVFGPHWDFDRALGSTDGRDANPRMWLCGPVFSSWYGPMFADVEAWQRWVDRYQQLRTAQLSDRYTGSLMDQLANQIRQAEKRDYDRWKIKRRGGSYQAELDAMKRWVSNRLDYVDRQLSQPPVPSLASGQISPGTSLTLSLGPNPTAVAAIWYTLDGTDPRGVGASNRSPSAILYTGPIRLTQDVRVVARTLDTGRRQTAGPPTSTPWSGPVARTFLTHRPPLTLTEIHFHPAGDGNDSSHTADDFEFLELKNTSGTTLDLANFQLTGDVTFTFGSQRAVKLAPDARCVVASHTNAFVQRYGKEPLVAGRYSGQLSDSRGRLRLTDPQGAVVLDFTYEDTWVRPADGDGYSMVVRSEALAAYELDTPSAWVPSAEVHGSPGAPDLASDVSPDTDTDGDGLADAWERKHFGTLQPDGAQDADGDGVSNRDEFVAGTNPLRADSVPYLEAVPSPFGGNPLLRFHRSGARPYSLLYRDGVDGTSWRELLRFPAADEPVGQFRDLTTTNVTRFYRLATP